MNDGAFSEKPMPDGARCPHCGAAMPAKSEMCWLCREKYAVRAGRPMSLNVPPRQAANTGLMILAAFGVLGILLGITMLIETPGLLPMFAVLTLPAFIRTILSSDSADALPTFLAWTGVTVMLTCVAMMAFVTTFVVSCIGALLLATSVNRSFTIATNIACIVGIVIFFFALILVWRSAAMRRGGAA